MATPDDNRQESRPPTIDDLVMICEKLNEEKAKYIVIRVKKNNKKWTHDRTEHYLF